MLMCVNDCTSSTLQSLASFVTRYKSYNDLRCILLALSRTHQLPDTMLRFAVSKAATVTLRPALCATAPRAVVATAFQQPQQRFFSAKEDEEIVKVVLADSLEWALSSPPPIHQFDEPPIVVEIAEA